MEHLHGEEPISSEPTFSIWVRFASVGIMSNAQFLSPWPNIAKKIENSYYFVPYENDVLGPVSPNLLLGTRGVGDGWAGWDMPPKVWAE